MPGKGISELMKRQAEATARRQANEGERYNAFFLTDNDQQARFRFLTDGEELLVAGFHSIWITTPKGKRFMRQVICTEDENCIMCNSEEDSRRTKKTMFRSWVWVYEILHPAAPSGIETTPRKIGQKTYYVQAVDEPRLWTGGYYISLDVQNFYGEYGTLTDRDYKLKRTGGRGQTNTQHSLIPGDAKPFEKEVPDLPDLEDISIKEGERALGINLNREASVDAEAVPFDEEETKEYDF